MYLHLLRVFMCPRSIHKVYEHKHTIPQIVPNQTIPDQNCSRNLYVYTFPDPPVVNTQTTSPETRDSRQCQRHPIFVSSSTLVTETVVFIDVT